MAITLFIPSLSGSSIGCKLYLMKQMSQVRIPLPLLLCGHVKNIYIYSNLFMQFSHSISKTKLLYNIESSLFPSIITMYNIP
jgi:hypothetical protein